MRLPGRRSCGLSCAAQPVPINNDNDITNKTAIFFILPPDTSLRIHIDSSEFVNRKQLYQACDPLSKELLGSG
jgi:hypothetical protein